MPIADSIEFLGFHVSSYGIRPLPSRVDTVCSLSVPKDEKDFRRYIGMFSFYQRFIPHSLLYVNSSGSFVWSDQHQQVLQNLKSALTSCVALTFPAVDANMTITTDASAHSIGACLHQVIDGDSQPLSFFSRKLSNTERQYSTFDRELLAIFAAVKRWKEFIHGHSVTVFTDHRPIVGAFSNTKPRFSDRQQRQFSVIAEYVNDIIYVAGSENIVADTLSRIPESDSNIASVSEVVQDPDPIFPIDLPGIAASQEQADFDRNNFKTFPVGSRQLFCEVSQPTPRPFIPTDLRRAIFDSLHILSHPGRKASFRLINSRYFWPNMKTDINPGARNANPVNKTK